MEITISIIVLGAIGLIAAVLLYLAAKKFYVYEDPKIGEIEEILPGANCGGCGLSGCHAFAVECANATTMEGLNCAGIDDAGMKKIADIVGLTPVETETRGHYQMLSLLRKPRPSKSLRRRKVVRHRGCTLSRGIRLHLRMPRLRRLRESLSFRSHDHQYGGCPPEGGQRKMHRLREMCRSLSPRTLRACPGTS